MPIKANNVFFSFQISRQLAWCLKWIFEKHQRRGRSNKKRSGEEKTHKLSNSSHYPKFQGAALGSRVSSADRRYQQLRGLYETTEKKCSDAEQQVRNLQREVQQFDVYCLSRSSSFSCRRSNYATANLPVRSPGSSSKSDVPRYFN